MTTDLNLIVVIREAVTPALRPLPPGTPTPPLAPPPPPAQPRRKLLQEEKSCSYVSNWNRFGIPILHRRAARRRLSSARGGRSKRLTRKPRKLTLTETRQQPPSLTGSARSPVSTPDRPIMTK